MAISKIGSKALVDCSVATADLEDGSITNAKLANSSITVNGTSVSLGASASLKDISWQSVVTADGSTATTAVAGNGYFIDTTSAAHTINLPSSPSIGDKIAIKDYAGTFATNILTIGRNGNNIQGVANDSLIITNRASIILVYSDATKGWLYTVESNVADLQFNTYISATGGTVSTSGDYKIHTFTGDGCFVVSCAGGGGSGPNVVDYLVVAGGGGGGIDRGGGGGAGGFRESHSTPVSGCYTASPLATPTGITISATTYPVTVGAGGPGGPGTPPSASQDPNLQSGSNSVFSTITSTGGGGGMNANVPVPQRGIPGGSGGGGAGSGIPACGNAGSGNTPPVSPPQGNPGGNGFDGPAPSVGGGGGGSGNAASAAGPGGGGDGGIGSETSISGSAVRYSGGGGGGSPPSYPGGPAGSGGTYPGLPGSDPQATRYGGGNGNFGCAQSGLANTGGGGGARGDTGGPAAAGGKGVVVIRYKFQ